jgi:hypothetical protein
VGVGATVPLDVTSTGDGAGSADGTIGFTLSLGSDPTSLDSSGLASVVVTVDAMPSADGQPLGATIQAYFLDGNELDQAFTARVATAIAVCPSRN